MRNPTLAVVLSSALCVASLPASAVTNGELDALADRLKSSHPEIPQAPLRRLFQFMKSHYVPNTRYVTVIDFDKPSDRKRMYLINLDQGTVESFLVAHGSGSGRRTPEEFSDRPGSHESSLGIYLTGGDYDGGNGRSMILKGMEGSNNMAESRKVVLHGADYVSPGNARDGAIGRSHGCPAVEMKYVNKIINALEGGSAMIIHAT